MSSKKIRNIILIVIAIGTVVYLRYPKDVKQKTAKDEVFEAVPVEVERVQLIDVQRALEYVGDIKAEGEVLVYPKVSGKIIEKIKEDGAEVSKGDVIAYIDRDEVGLKFEKAPVESPLSGIIGRVYVDKGTNVNTLTPVALIVDMNNVKVDLDIPEEYLPKVVLGQPAEISLEAYPDEKFIGTVKKISPVLDLETRTAPIEIVISNKDHRLKSGMFAKVRLIIEEHKSSPVILKEAIIGKEPNTYVYVVENNIAILKKIVLGIRQGPYFEVKEGLKAGDPVVIMGQQKLRNNIQVIVETKENRE